MYGAHAAAHPAPHARHALDRKSALPSCARLDLLPRFVAAGDAGRETLHSSGERRYNFIGE